MMSKEQIAHMKEQMRPSEELVAQIKERVNAEPSPSKAKRVWIPRVAAACAAAVLVTAAGWKLPQLLTLTAEEPLDAAPAPTLAGMESPEPAVGGAVSGAFISGTPLQEGVYLPKIKLSEPKPGVIVDMVGLIVYRGNIYTWTDSLSLTKEQEAALRGEHLGRTKGNINEWSEQDDYATEFASAIGEEEVYAMKDYDVDFRIMTSDGEGNVGIYERLNDIWLATGEDLFGKMKLKGRLEAIFWQSFDEWDNGAKNWRVADISEEAADAFLDGLYRSEYLEKAGWRELAPKFCCLTLTDGTQVRLMLLQGGYIKYLGMGGNGVFQMEDSSFSAVYDALS